MGHFFFISNSTKEHQFVTSAVTMMSNEICLSLQTTNLNNTTYYNRNFKTDKIRYSFLLSLFDLFCDNFQKLAKSDFEHFSQMNIPIVTASFSSSEFIIQVNNIQKSISIFNLNEEPIYEISGLKICALNPFPEVPNHQLQ